MLPLKSEYAWEEARAIRASFREVQPKLLLFLQKLQCIAISDAVEGTKTVMVRRPADGWGPHVHELRHGPGARHVTRWLKVSSDFEPALQRLDVKVDKTAVAVAFPLDGQQPSPQPVYAFLPLREFGLRCGIRWRRAGCMPVLFSYCMALYRTLWQPTSLASCHDSVIVSTTAVECLLLLLPPCVRWQLNASCCCCRSARRFMVQADFIVPASRETVQRDCAWNEALRDKVPELVVGALERFRELPVPPGAGPLHWVCWWLRSLPLPDEAQVG